MAGNDPRDQRALLVVARGQASLLEALREFVADLGWVDVIEDRRAGPSLLPRADRAATGPQSRSDPATSSGSGAR
jgi:hypothetical protein